MLKIDFLTGLELLGTEQDTLHQSKVSDHNFPFHLTPSSGPEHVILLSLELSLHPRGVVILDLGYKLSLSKSFKSMEYSIYFNYLSTLST